MPVVPRLEDVIVDSGLAKSTPDPEVARRPWPGIEKAANVAGLAGFALELASAIQKLIG